MMVFGNLSFASAHNLEKISVFKGNSLIKFRCLMQKIQQTSPKSLFHFENNIGKVATLVNILKTSC